MQLINRRSATSFLLAAAALSVSPPAAYAQEESSGEPFDYLSLQSYAEKILPDEVTDRVKMGGELRTRFEYRADMDYARGQGDEDGFVLNRTTFWMDLMPFGETLRVHAALRDSRNWLSHAPHPKPDQDRFDLHELYAEIQAPEKIPLTLKVGRQELIYGKQRLIGAFNWSNLGRVFDAMKLSYHPDTFRVDFFYANVVKKVDDHFDDADYNDKFFGIYGTTTAIPRHTLDLYLLLLSNQDGKTPGRGGETGDREVYTVGTRFEGKPFEAGVLKGLDYGGEIAFQFGTYGGDAHRALAFFTGTGYTFDVWAEPRMGVEFNYASGDNDPRDGRHETFDNLYPTNHLYYGYMDLFSWRNLLDFNIKTEFKPLKRMTCVAAFHFFGRANRHDAWYNAGGRILRDDPGGDFSREVGKELDLVFSYELQEHLNLLLGYSHFFAGPFVADTGSSHDADFLYTMLTFTF